MRRAPLSLAAVAVVALAGCGGVPEGLIDADAVACPSGSDCYDEPKPAGAGGTIEVQAGDLFFELIGVQAEEGPVTVTLENIGAADHNFTIDEAYGNTQVPADADLPGGETAEGVLELFAGTYTFYCSVPGHRAAGMEGTLEIALPGEAPSAGPTPSPEDTTEPVGEEGGASPGDTGAGASESDAPAEPQSDPPGGGGTTTGG